jgi:hypothetical protein
VPLPWRASRNELTAATTGEANPTGDAMPSKTLRRRTENLLRQARLLEKQLELFRRRAVAVTGPLDKLVGEAEAEAMVTPRATILGTLECLLADDLVPALRKLATLEDLLETDSQPIDLERDPALPSPAVPARRAAAA